MKVHFVCRGNAVRSLMADAYLKSLNLPGIEVTSSGSVAEKHREVNRVHFGRTVALLERHGHGPYVKPASTQLEQATIDEQDIVVCVNQRAYDEAQKIVTLPPQTIIWHIDDINEGTRIAAEDARDEFEEVIYQEVVENTNNLVTTFNLAATQTALRNQTTL